MATYTQAIGGSVGFGGNLVGNVIYYIPTPVLYELTNGGSLSFTGLLSAVKHGTSLIEIALNGQLYFQGLLQKAQRVLLDGELSFDGALIVIRNYIIAGILDFVGVLEMPFMLAGRLLFIGTISTKTNKKLSGTLSFTGILSAVLVKFFYGTLSFAGEIGTRLYKTLSGSLSFSGGIALMFKKRIGGSLSFTGALEEVKTFIGTWIQIGGSISFIGQLGKVYRAYTTFVCKIQQKVVVIKEIFEKVRFGRPF